jgi:hypothetical protein
MRNRSNIARLALAAMLTASPVAVAHEAQKGPNGGWRVDAGNYHAELVVDGSTAVVVYLSDADNKPLPASGFKANAILVVDGKPQRFELQPKDDKVLAGIAPVAITPGVKGALQLTAPDGTTAQAKF